MGIYLGGNYKIVPLEYSRKSVVKLKADGSKTVEFIDFLGICHNSWTPLLAELNLLQWVFSLSKQNS